MIVAGVIRYFIVSMKKILTRPYTLTSRVGGFSYAGRELASTDVNSHGYSDGYSGPCLRAIHRRWPMCWYIFWPTLGIIVDCVWLHFLPYLALLSNCFCRYFHRFGIFDYFLDYFLAFDRKLARRTSRSKSTWRLRKLRRG